MNIDKTYGETLLRAVTNAIRYAHMEDSGYDIRKLQDLHGMLVAKMYRSQEMRSQNWLPKSILEGTDLGMVSTVIDIVGGKSKIEQRLRKELKNFN